jgi:O-antigen/teichoic acid export membrane protein
VVTLTVAYCGTVALLAEPVLRFTYGASFADAADITVLVAITYVIAAMHIGYGVALKAAAQLRHLWLIRFTSAAVSIVVMVVFVSSFGLIGAGWANIVTDTIYTLGVVAVYHWMCRYSTIAVSGRREGHQRPHPGNLP